MEGSGKIKVQDCFFPFFLLFLFSSSFFLVISFLLIIGVLQYILLRDTSGMRIRKVFFLVFVFLPSFLFLFRILSPAYTHSSCCMTRVFFSFSPWFAFGAKKLYEIFT